MRTETPYKALQHCWMQFQCPEGFVAEYYFDYFSTYSSYHIIWLTGEGFKKDFSGTLTSSYLYKWLPTNTGLLDFQFRTDSSTVAKTYGYKMRLRCARDS